MTSNIHNQRKWTPDEIKSVGIDYQSYLDKDLMIKKYNRNWDNIVVKAHQLGYRRKMPSEIRKKKSSLSKKEMQNLYYKGYTIGQISKIAGIGADVVDFHLNSINTKMREGTYANRKYPVKEHFFDKIDTEEKAYILGLLYADGYNDEHGACILALQERDKEILDKITKIIQPTKPLRYSIRKIGVNCYTLAIENFHITQCLKKVGCVKAKSLILKFPTTEQVPTNLINHFIRGYFDGDGCITKSESIRSNCTFSLEGNDLFLFKLQKILMDVCNLKYTKPYQRHKGRKSSINIRYCGTNQIKRIFDYLYKDATIYLNRKYNKFIDICK